jgi:hypothetical protein
MEYGYDTMVDETHKGSLPRVRHRPRGAADGRAAGSRRYDFGHPARPGTHPRHRPGLEPYRLDGMP